VILEVNDRLVEEAVLGAAADERRFHREREAAYSTSDRDARERAFAELHRRWFCELGLDRPIRAALGEHPAFAATVSRCAVSAAARAAEEGAELFVRADLPEGAERRRLVVRLRARTLLDETAALALLRAEFLHVADMLDPSFGYQPRLPPASAGPTEDRLLLERYGAAWSATVVGRLVRRGQLPPAARDRALARFLAAFPMFKGDPEPAFGRFFGARPSHAEMVRFAQAPRAETLAPNDRGSRCPLCALPSYSFEEVRDARVRAAIASDFPEWNARHHACPQCADLYRARAAPCS